MSVLLFVIGHWSFVIGHLSLISDQWLVGKQRITNNK